MGQALRARPPRGPDHVVRSRSGLERVHGARLRSARRRARRDRRRAAAVAAATEDRTRASAALAIVSCSLAAARLPAAGVLPEDRADVLLHSYDGGGVTIQGPSLLVRKQFAQKFSASANYYVDKVSSASIDVVTTASPYEEERTQYSVGLDYLHDRWMMNIGFTNSEENDYTAETVELRHEPRHLRRSHDDFARLLAWQRRRRPARRPDVQRHRERQHYRLGVSQILTKNLLLGLSFETITDEGFLNNPYRQVRYLDPSDAARLQLRARDLSAHAHERRRRGAAALLLAVARGDPRRVPPVLGHLGLSSRTRSSSAIRTRSSRAGSSKASCVRTRRPRPISTATCSRARSSRTSWRATRSSARSRANRSGSARATTSCAAAGSSSSAARVNVIFDHIMFDYEDFRDSAPTSAWRPAPSRSTASTPTSFQVFVSFWF